MWQKNWHKIVDNTVLNVTPGQHVLAYYPPDELGELGIHYVGAHTLQMDLLPDDFEDELKRAIEGRREAMVKKTRGFATDLLLGKLNTCQQKEASTSAICQLSHIGSISKILHFSGLAVFTESPLPVDKNKGLENVTGGLWSCGRNPVDPEFTIGPNNEMQLNGISVTEATDRSLETFAYALLEDWRLKRFPVLPDHPRCCPLKKFRKTVRAVLDAPPDLTKEQDKHFKRFED